jgi:hypothetical protein
MERSTRRQWSRVTFLDTTPPWVLESLTALDKMTELGDNWDGYGSPRIQPGALISARKLIASVELQDLPAPHACPVSGGHVGLHWRVGSRELELTVLPDAQIEYLKVLDQDLEREDSMQAGVLAAEHSAELERMLTWLIRG